MPYPGEVIAATIDGHTHRSCTVPGAPACTHDVDGCGQHLMACDRTHGDRNVGGGVESYTNCRLMDPAM
jgi:hypothetical protein